MRVRVWSFRIENGKVPVKWKLTGLLLGILTALFVLVAVYELLGGYPDDGGLVGGIAGTSAAMLLDQTFGRLRRHAFKTYFALVFFNTLAAALVVKHFGLTPHGALTFMVELTALYIPLMAVDYVVIKAMKKKYGWNRG